MVDIKEEMYNHAIRAEISDSMAYGFKRNLAYFKSEEQRKEEERIAAQMLVNLTS